MSFRLDPEDIASVIDVNVFRISYLEDSDFLFLHDILKYKITSDIFGTKHLEIINTQKHDSTSIFMSRYNSNAISKFKVVKISNNALTFSTS